MWLEGSLVTCNGLHGDSVTCNGPWHKEGVRVTGKSVRDDGPDGFNYLGGGFKPILRALVGTASRPTASLQTFGHTDELSTFAILSTFPKVDDSLSQNRISPALLRRVPSCPTNFGSVSSHKSPRRGGGDFTFGLDVALTATCCGPKLHTVRLMCAARRIVMPMIHSHDA